MPPQAVAFLKLVVVLEIQVSGMVVFVEVAEFVVVNLKLRSNSDKRLVENLR